MSDEGGLTLKGLLGIVLAATIGVPLFIYLVIKLFTGGISLDGNVSSMSKEAVAARLHQAGVVKVVVSAPAGSRTGQMVYDGICMTCHAAGLSGSPKLGDPAAWAPRLAQGLDTLTQHAVNGFNAMPAKGGDPGLTDDEIKRAVAYMGNTAGAKFTEPPVTDASGVAVKLDPAVKGKEIYEGLCVSCHGAGLYDSPKFGDKAAWAPRLKDGTDAAVKIGIQGKGAMPPKGGYLGSDAEFAVAAQYMIEHSK